MFENLSLYVHLPFCIKKCPYCDFNSHSLQNFLPLFNNKNNNNDELQQLYIKNLLNDFEQNFVRNERLNFRKINTIFFGGGTPNIFSTRNIEFFLNSIQKYFANDDNIEITLECNPGAVDNDKNYKNNSIFKQWKSIGINRISLGVQSFNDLQLQQLGRIHNAKDAIYTLENIVKYFDNFNIDLMLALPLQNLQNAISDIKTALSFNPPHLSCYRLTIEENTYFGKYPPPLPNEDLCIDIENSIKQILVNDFKYNNYEISAYSLKDNWQCKHNLNYWKFGDYLGIGAGAHSKLTFTDNNNNYNNYNNYNNNYIIQREVRYKNPKKYLTTNDNVNVNDNDNDYIENRYTITEIDDLILEFLMNYCRLNIAFSTSEMQQKIGIKNLFATQSYQKFLQNLNIANNKNFITIHNINNDKNNLKIQMTNHGRLFLNQFLHIFV